jgi:hypothetical protein
MNPLQFFAIWFMLGGIQNAIMGFRGEAGLCAIASLLVAVVQFGRDIGNA